MSGHSDTHILHMAHEKHKEENNGVTFNFGHVWNISNDRSLFSSQSNDEFNFSKKVITSDSGTNNSSSTKT